MALTPPMALTPRRSRELKEHRVEKTIKDTKGVFDVEVNYEQGTATVQVCGPRGCEKQRGPRECSRVVSRARVFLCPSLSSRREPRWSDYTN